MTRADRPSLQASSMGRGAVMAAARLLMALIFVLTGLGKLGAVAATQAYMQSRGVPAALFWPTVAFEVGSGLLVVAGFQTRIVAVLMAGFCLVTAAVFHSHLADQTQMIMLLKNLSMAGGFLLLAIVGAGPLSLDARLGRD